MNTKVLLGVVALLACSAVSADELGARLAGAPTRAPAAMLYLEFPIAARHRERPAFGLRMERSARIDFAGFRADGRERSATLLEVPFNKKRDGEDTQALNLIGKPVIVIGIVAGALLVVNALDDDDDGGGGGY
jgi:hypothetical protein